MHFLGEDMTELLSPAGDERSFYAAIESGADAVYLGAPKFNARMKAENFTMDKLSILVRYAHLKQVKVYITLNTLVSSAEMKEVISVVGDCLRAGVDAFIVQDYGIVYTLKSVYPDIVLHASTQMAVHNWRGAKVAKDMGLSRVVLSREVTLDDIREIRERVDIELELFIQGALCVAFSGNCYMSSIKNSASGNRGECKQLCRLPYTMKTKSGEHSGYMLSPRDICNLDYLEELLSLGIESFKIEGRLRRPGYVSTTTRIYREAIDSYFAGQDYDTDTAKGELKKVFSRGEYISGYFDSNDIINTSINNHIGEPVGRVLSCIKFKDIYKITLKVDTGVDIHSGDGLKFEGNGDYVSMGVGNVEYVSDNVVVYGKNYINTGSTVYRAVDSKFEENNIDKSKYRELTMDFEGYIGNKARLRLKSMDYSVEVYGAECERPKTRGVSNDNIINQLSKVDKSIYSTPVINIAKEDIFISLSNLNEMRREAIERLESQILGDRVLEVNKMPNIEYEEPKYSSMAIVSSKGDISKLSKEYERLIYAPISYSVGNVRDFVGEYSRYYKNTPLLYIPIIAMSSDLKVIDGIVESMGSNMGLYVNNIYGLDYIHSGIEVVAGTGMNVANDYSASMLHDMGVSEITCSFERWCAPVPNTYRYEGYIPLMTFVHCPYKTINHNTCDKCSYRGEITLIGSGSTYSIRRYRIDRCYFELIDSVLTTAKGRAIIRDLR